MTVGRGLARLATCASLAAGLTAGGPWVAAQGTVSAGVALAGHSAQALAAIAAGEAPAALSPLGLPCRLTVTARAMPGAMVALDVMEPCAPHARITVSHGALTFATRSDAFGLLTLDIPALTTPASFTIRLGGDQPQAATTRVDLPDLGAYDRHAIVWEKDPSLHLHAMEEGSAFGGPGHVWQGAPGRIEAAIAGTGAFLATLGDADSPAPHMAQVLTIPRALGDRLRLSVEIPVTADTCDQPVTAIIVRAPAGVRPVSSHLSVVLPDCDAVGEFVMVPGLFAPPISAGD